MYAILSYTYITITRKGVSAIARKSVPINVIMYYPQTEDGRQELAKRVAEVHADMVNRTIQKLNCTSEQKEKLLDAIMDTVAARSMSKSRGGRAR